MIKSLFRRMADSATGLMLAVMFVIFGGGYAALSAYDAYRADMREDMVTAMQSAPTKVDIVSECAAWVARQGITDNPCQPFMATEWAIMNGGRVPAGDNEGMADWFYFYVPDGTMIMGPGRVRIWIPADRQTCPQVMVGTMTDGMCPTWMPTEQ